MCARWRSSGKGWPTEAWCLSGMGKNPELKTGEMMPGMAEIKFDAGGDSGVGRNYEPNPPHGSQLSLGIYERMLCNTAALSDEFPWSGHRTAARASETAKIRYLSATDPPCIQ